MKWNVEGEITTGVCMTNDHAREMSYIIVKRTKNRDTVVDILPSRESAEKIFRSTLHDMRKEMSAKKSPVATDLVLRKHVKTGTQVERFKDADRTGVRIRWDSEETKAIKTESVDKYSSAYARRIAKRKI